MPGHSSLGTLTLRIRVRLPLLLLVFTALTAGSSFGAPFTVDGWASGDAKITRDPATGLDWLDLTVTHNVSVAAFSSGFGGLTSQGFRIATREEVTSLFLNFGAMLSNDVTAASYPVATTIFDFLGCTLCVPFNLPSPSPPTFDIPAAFDHLYTQGMMWSGDGLSYSYAEIFRNNTGRVNVDPLTQLRDLAHSQNGTGIFAVRDTPSGGGLLPGRDPSPGYIPPPAPIPEPSSILLTLAGLGIIARMRRN